MLSWLESLSQWMTGLPELGQAAVIFFVSMIPIVELRGAIPIGVHAGLPWYYYLPVCVLGNLFPVPFILFWVRRVFLWMKGYSRLIRLVYRLESRALHKADYVYRFQLAGLCLFVALPLPGTGAWSGALIAALLNMRIKYAFPAIGVGVTMAGVIMTALSYGVSWAMG